MRYPSTWSRRQTLFLHRRPPPPRWRGARPPALPGGPPDPPAPLRYGTRRPATVLRRSRSTWAPGSQAQRGRNEGWSALPAAPHPPAATFCLSAPSPRRLGVPRTCPRLRRPSPPPQAGFPPFSARARRVAARAPESAVAVALRPAGSSSRSATPASLPLPPPPHRRRRGQGFRAFT